MHVDIINVLVYAAVALGSIIGSTVACGVVEWILHAKVLHTGEPGDEAFEGHQGHHEDHTGANYKQAHQGEYSYGLPPVFFFRCVGSICILALTVSFLTPHPILLVSVATATAIAYFWFLGFLHRRTHAPVAGAWFEGTRVYAVLDRAHRVHHARGDRNFCIVLPFMDALFGTLHRPGRRSQLTETAIK